MASQVLQAATSVLGQGKEKVGLLWHMLEGQLLAEPLGLGPAAQYDCQQLTAVHVSLRLADLHGGFSCRLLTAGLKIFASGVVTLCRFIPRVLLCSALLQAADGGILGVTGWLLILVVLLCLRSFRLQMTATLVS